jgi:hypothetical protein
LKLGASIPLSVQSAGVTWKGDTVVPSSVKSGIGERKAVPVNDLPVTQEGKSFREDSHAFKEGWYHPCQQW